MTCPACSIFEAGFLLRAQILFQVFAGARPHLPDGLPPEYAAIITDCWQREPKRRPSFAQLHARISALHAALPRAA